MAKSKGKVDKSCWMGHPPFWQIKRWTKQAECINPEHDGAQSLSPPWWGRSAPTPTRKGR